MYKGIQDKNKLCSVKDLICQLEQQEFLVTLDPLWNREIKSSLAGEPLMHAYSLKSTFHLWFQIESLSFLLGLERLNGTLMDPMWNDYDKHSVKILTYLMEVG